MSKYPSVIDDACLAANARVSDEQIERDIRETEAEIEQLRAVGEAEAKIAANHLDPMERRLADFKSRARPMQCQERQDLIDFLRLLQAKRREVAGDGASTVP